MERPPELGFCGRTNQQDHNWTTHPYISVPINFSFDAITTAVPFLRTGTPEEAIAIRETDVPPVVDSDTYIPPKLLLTFFKPLANMMRAGIQPPDALRRLRTSIQHERLSELCYALESRVRSGMSLADAMKAFPRTFPELITSTIAVVSSGGKAGAGVAEVVTLIQDEVRLRSRIMKAAMYPLGTLAMTLAITAGMLLFVTPKLEPFYQQALAGDPHALPTATLVLLAASRGYRAHVWLWTGAFLCVGYAAARWMMSYQGRTLATAVLLRLPVVSTLADKIVGARFLRHLAMLHRAGKSTPECVVKAADAITIPELRERFEQLADRIDLGVTLDRAMQEANLFPNHTIVYVEAGFAAGNLPDMLDAAAADATEETDSLMETVLGFLPMGFLLITATIMSMLIFAQWGGLFAITKALGKVQ